MKVRGVILDLDGTVYRGREAVAGAAEFVRRVEETGIKYLFVTNRANRTPEEVCTQLGGFGISCGVEQVVTSAQVTADYIKTGRVFCVGEEGLQRELEARGITVTEEKPDYVVVSFDRTFTYAKLQTACRLIRAGAQFIATNPDRCLEVEGGTVPGTGALVAAVATGSGTTPVMMGKPERRIMDVSLQRLGLGPDETIAVGDNVETDIPAGQRAGMRTALILTGVSTRQETERAAVAPTWIVDGFEELWEIVRG